MGLASIELFVGSEVDEVFVVGVDCNLVLSSNKIEALFLKGLYYYYKFFIVHEVVEFYALELLQEEGNGVQPSFFILLSKLSSNSNPRGISLYFVGSL